MSRINTKILIILGGVLLLIGTVITKPQIFLPQVNQADAIFDQGLIMNIAEHGEVTKASFNFVVR